MRFIAALIGLVLALASPALAEERILNFVSDVTVNTDASLTVRETIDVLAQGMEINHGILRDFPTVYTDRNGIRVVVGFDVTGVKRDGGAEPYSIESISNGKRIKIGSGDVLLNPGEHRYEITYRTTRQIGFFPEYDELYWNVTGNGWTFPIDHAQSIIRLPAGAAINQHAEYTGPQGSASNDARVLGADGNRFTAEVNRRLDPGEGFTVAVAWQKGIVTPPSDSEKWGWWISDNAGYAVLVLTLIGAFGYYLYAWNRVGRDPPKGTIIPLFRPPQGLGPAGVRYITQYGFDDRAFAAALVGLAVKGRLTIADDDDSYTITWQPAPKNAEPLARAEQALYDALPNGNLRLRQSNHVIVRRVKQALVKALDEEFDGRAFLLNYKWFAIGLVISLAGLVLSALLLPAEIGGAGLAAMAWTTIWWGVIIGVGWGLVKGLIGQRGIARKFFSLLGLLFLVPFMGGGLLAPVLIGLGADSPGLFVLIGAAVLLGVTNVLFFFLLRAPTIEGRKLMDEIEGFKLYMKTAEEDRLNMLNPPEKTPALFERYLPYALALDCENEWNAKFAAVLAVAAAAGAAAAPAWYSGSHWDSGRTGGFTDSLGSSLASSVASASTAPGSSSGSGGGGSSGGGGGGGGGSGW